ncbi:MAG: hypothetical protein LCH46_07265 [Proteobacteria bacterium]|nr:hypothetical protein [Pseudomonadota bacterium]
MSEVDPAYVMFPNDVPTAPPDYVAAQKAGAMQRLQGKHIPLTPMIIGNGTQDSIVLANTERQEPEKPKDPISQVAHSMYPDDAPPAYDTREFEKLTGNYVEAAKLDGDTERAKEIEAATSALVAHAQKTGTTPETLAEAMQIVNGRAAIGPPSDDQVSTNISKARVWCQENGVTDADLAAGKRMLDDLDEVSPGVWNTLAYSQAANDPKMIALIVKEAKRRGYRA